MIERLVAGLDAWPRSLAGDLAPADRIALERAAEAARLDLRERVAVGFDDPPR